MNIYDPEFQPNWLLPELKGTVIHLEPEPQEKICIPTTYGNVYVTEDELAKYSQERENEEE